jgi:DNA-binding beta-propeller fold protein YncE
MTQLVAPPVPPPATPGRGRRRAIGALAGLGVAAAVAAVVALAGDDEGGGGGEAPAKPRLVVSEDAGEFPVGVTVDGDSLLVASRDDGRLARFPIQDGELGDPVTRQIPGAEMDFLVPGRGEYLWTADEVGNLLIEVDSETLAPTGLNFSTGEYPRDVLVKADTIWVTDRKSNTLTKIVPSDEESGEAIQTIPTGGKFPRRLTFDGSRIWASFKFSNNVQAFELESGAPAGEPIAVGAEPHGLLAADGYLWVANTGGDSVTKLTLADLDAPAETFEDVCREPRDVELAFGSLWVACGAGSEVVELDPKDGTQLASLGVGGELETIASSEDPDRLWVGGGDSGKVFGIDPGD